MNKLFTQDCGELIRVELLLCPFCGNPADENSQYPRFVNCTRPGCQLSESRMPKGIHFDVWNRHPGWNALRAYNRVHSVKLDSLVEVEA